MPTGNEYDESGLRVGPADSDRQEHSSSARIPDPHTGQTYNRPADALSGQKVWDHAGGPRRIATICLIFCGDHRQYDEAVSANREQLLEVFGGVMRSNHVRHPQNRYHVMGLNPRTVVSMRVGTWRDNPSVKDAWGTWRLLTLREGEEPWEIMPCG